MNRPPRRTVFPFPFLFLTDSYVPGVGLRGSIYFIFLLYDGVIITTVGVQCMSAQNFMMERIQDRDASHQALASAVEQLQLVTKITRTIHNQIARCTSKLPSRPRVV